MKKIKVYLALGVLCLLCGPGTGLAKTMYVTDRLYLSLRSGPDPEAPSLGLLRSDTKVYVLDTEGKWAKVTLEDGRTGWVMKKFLVEDMPKFLMIEELQGQIASKNITLQRLRGENASLKKEIETLKNQITQQDKRREMTTKENSVKRLKEIYAIGIVALLLGLIIGYLVKRPKGRRYLLPRNYTDRLKSLDSKK